MFGGAFFRTFFSKKLGVVMNLAENCAVYVVYAHLLQFVDRRTSMNECLTGCDVELITRSQICLSCIVRFDARRALCFIFNAIPPDAIGLPVYTSVPNINFLRFGFANAS